CSASPQLQRECAWRNPDPRVASLENAQNQETLAPDAALRSFQRPPPIPRPSLDNEQHRATPCRQVNRDRTDKSRDRFQTRNPSETGLRVAALRRAARQPRRSSSRVGLLPRCHAESLSSEQTRAGTNNKALSQTRQKLFCSPNVRARPG